MRWIVLAVAATLLAACNAPKPAPAPKAAENGPPAGGASILTWTPEQQLYGYRNMEKIAPVGVVRRGHYVRELRTAAAPIDPKFTHAGKAYDTAAYMAEYRASGVLVLKDGQIVLERYALGRQPNERWTSFSVAKSVTSTLVGAAIRDGKIKSLDDPITRYIPALKGSAYDVVKVRDLITMTSGVKWNEDYEDLNSDVAKVGLQPPVGGENPVVSYMKTLPREFPPGTHFTYDTGETDLAGILVSSATGKSLSDYLSEKIWIPYGMEQDAVWVKDTAGHERGGCCLSLTLRDYARFGQFILDGAQAGGKAVVPTGWVADASAAHVKEPGYGYFWWIFPQLGQYEAEGIFGQSVTIVPKERLVIVINSAWPKAWDDNLDAGRMAFIKAIRESAAKL
jgi:CubicO group peptidase (beta-lactamase class C family)